MTTKVPVPCHAAPCGLHAGRWSVTPVYPPASGAQVRGVHMQSLGCLTAVQTCAIASWGPLQADLCRDPISTTAQRHTCLTNESLDRTNRLIFDLQRCMPWIHTPTLVWGNVHSRPLCHVLYRNLGMHLHCQALAAHHPAAAATPSPPSKQHHGPHGTNPATTQ